MSVIGAHTYHQAFRFRLRDWERAENVVDQFDIIPWLDMSF